MGLTVHWSFRTKRRTTSVRRAFNDVYVFAHRLPVMNVGRMRHRTEVWYADHTNCDAVDLAAATIERGRGVARRRFLVTPLESLDCTIDVGPGCESMDLQLQRFPGMIEVPYADLSKGQLARIRTGLAGWSGEGFCKTGFAANPAHGGSLANFLKCHLCVTAILDKCIEVGLIPAPAPGTRHSAHISDESDYFETRSLPALAAHGTHYGRAWTQHVESDLREYFGRCPYIYTNLTQQELAATTVATTSSAGSRRPRNIRLR